MKKTKIAALLSAYFRLGVAANSTNYSSTIWTPVPGMVPDNSALFGILGALQNLDLAIDFDLICLNGAASTAITLTAAQLLGGILDYTGSAAGGVTLTTPTAAQLIAGAPNTINPSGFNSLVYIINDGSGQTVTLANGSNVTVTGNNTIANNTMRQFLMNINVNAGTVTFVNMGTQNL